MGLSVSQYLLSEGVYCIAEFKFYCKKPAFLLVFFRMPCISIANACVITCIGIVGACATYFLFQRTIDSEEENVRREFDRTAGDRTQALLAVATATVSGLCRRLAHCCRNSLVTSSLRSHSLCVSCFRSVHDRPLIRGQKRIGVHQRRVFTVCEQHSI